MEVILLPLPDRFQILKKVAVFFKTLKRITLKKYANLIKKKRLIRSKPFSNYYLQFAIFPKLNKRVQFFLPYTYLNNKHNKIHTL